MGSCCETSTIVRHAKFALKPISSLFSRLLWNLWKIIRRKKNVVRRWVFFSTALASRHRYALSPVINLPHDPPAMKSASIPRCNYLKRFERKMLRGLLSWFMTSSSREILSLLICAVELWNGNFVIAFLFIQKRIWVLFAFLQGRVRRVSWVRGNKFSLPRSLCSRCFIFLLRVAFLLLSTLEKLPSRSRPLKLFSFHWEFSLF